MAPASAQRRKPRENQYLFDLGVKGRQVSELSMFVNVLTDCRKTGLTVPDSGIRDEHGLEPMDHLFSSPEKPTKSNKTRSNGTGKNANSTLSSEEDMDLGQSTFCRLHILDLRAHSTHPFDGHADIFPNDRHYTRAYSRFN